MPILGTIASSKASAVSGPGYEALISYVVPSDTGAVTLSSIPTTYQHLEVWVLGSTNRGTFANDTFSIEINGGTVTRSQWIGYDGSAIAYYYGASNGYYGITTGASANYNSNAQGGGILRINDYANTTTGKTYLSISGYATNSTSTALYSQPNVTTGIWNTSNAITSLTFKPGNASNIVAGSKFWIYGIKGS
jgi:hypothetical protein